MNYSQQDVVKRFRELYGQEELIVRSPGRINLIGEHVDYNDGLVMPAGINYATTFCLTESDDNKSEIYALKYNELYTVDILDPKPINTPKWVNYLLGIVRQFVDRNFPLKHFKCVFGGDIPMGAGLSSSASIECGFAYALNCLNKLNIEKRELMMIAQWAEHNYVGVKCGIMDQFATMMGAANNVVLLDCRTMEFEYCPFDLSVHDIILCDTQVKHSLVDSEYNARRDECEEGVGILQRYYPIRNLRDVSEEVLCRHKHQMHDKVFDRCLYVIQEIDRVQQAGKDLRNRDLQEFGKKMFATHKGLSELYEVSCAELDFLVDEAKTFRRVLGARMMGGGFGGCTINLIDKLAAPRFIEETSERYYKTFGYNMQSYNVSLEAGTSLIDIPVSTPSYL